MAHRGLEAVIAIHLVHNLLLDVSGLAYGGFAESTIDAEATGHPVLALVTWVATGIVTAALVGLARGAGYARPGWLTPAVG